MMNSRKRRGATMGIETPGTFGLDTKTYPLGYK
jgi:hypothetical protein